MPNILHFSFLSLHRDAREIDGHVELKLVVRLSLFVFVNKTFDAQYTELKYRRAFKNIDAFNILIGSLVVWQ